MKKIIFIISIFLVSFTSKSQEFNLGLSAALPVSDAGDFYTFGLILDAGYLYEITEKFKLGGSTGYLYSFGKEFEITLQDPLDPVVPATKYEDGGFIPVSASLRFLTNNNLTFGADFGYAFEVQSENAEDGGFYYAIKAQYGITETLGVLASYRAVLANTDFVDLNFGFASLGLMARF